MYNHIMLHFSHIRGWKSTYIIECALNNRMNTRNAICFELTQRGPIENLGRIEITKTPCIGFVIPMRMISKDLKNLSRCRMKRHCALNLQKIVKGITKFYYVVRTFIWVCYTGLYYDNIGSGVYFMYLRVGRLALRGGQVQSVTLNIVF